MSKGSEGKSKKSQPKADPPLAEKVKSGAAAGVKISYPDPKD